MISAIKTIVKACIRVLRILKREGLGSLEAKMGNFMHKQDIVGFYNYIIEDNFNDDSFSGYFNLPIKDRKLIINWVIPEMGLGSGGHLNILRMVLHLQSLGHENRIYLFNSNKFADNEQLRQYLITNYNVPEESKVVFFRSHQSMDFAHATIATSWHTAYCVRDFKRTKKKFYFVQDFEPFFYPKGSEYVFAENTYKFGFFGITAGQWLADELSTKYDMSCQAFGFSYDKDLYKPLERRDTTTKRVIFYARPVTARRSFEIGLLALNILYKKMPGIGLIFVGWDVSNYNIPFPHLNAGSVSLEELPDLYSQCDIALVLSNTNLSLLPLEIMACKCVVVSNKGKNVEWLLNEENSVLVDWDPNEIANEMERYLLNEELCREKRKRDIFIQ